MEFEIQIHKQFAYSNLLNVQIFIYGFGVVLDISFVWHKNVGMFLSVFDYMHLELPLPGIHPLTGIAFACPKKRSHGEDKKCDKWRLKLGDREREKVMTDKKNQETFMEKHGSNILISLTVREQVKHTPCLRMRVANQQCLAST